MILTYIEHLAGTISKTSLVAIGSALRAKEAHGYSRVVGVVLGGEGTEKAAAAVRSYGLDEIVYGRAEALEHYLVMPYAVALQQVIAELQPAMVLGVASSLGKDLFPRIARSLDAGQVSDCLAFLPERRFRRPMFAGNVLAEVEVATARCVVTVRGSAFDPALRSEKESPMRALALAEGGKGGQEFVAFDRVKSERPELTEAEVVVSGGRALKSSENFEKFIIPLADALGAAVGASRAAVDAGYAPNDWQVGQTGKVVAPRLYIAVGISGAIQHLAGMKDSQVIVAINRDPDAPIAEIADYSLVGDLFQLIPELTEAVRKAKV